MRVVEVLFDPFIRDDDGLALNAYAEGLEDSDVQWWSVFVYAIDGRGYYELRETQYGDIAAAFTYADGIARAHGLQVR